MTRHTTMDKTRLAAFVDGELSPEEAAAVVIHLADHPEDQAWVDDLAAANAALARAYSAPMHEPVPPAIRDTILPPASPGTGAAGAAPVLPFRRRVLASARAGWSAAAVAALAAAAAGVALLAPVAPVPGPGAGATATLAVGAVAEGTPLAAALSGLRSGEARTLDGGQTLTVLATMPVAGGHCREVEIDDAAAGVLGRALACTRGAGWTVTVAISEVAATPDAEGVFAPAGGGAAADLGPWLDRMGAGLALGAADEAAAIARGWR